NAMVQSRPSSAEQDGKWSTGLCECWGDMDDCCCAFWCLPLFVFKTNRRAGGCPSLPLLDCVGCGTPASLAMRAAVRERYVLLHCTKFLFGNDLQQLCNCKHEYSYTKRHPHTNIHAHDPMPTHTLTFHPYDPLPKPCELVAISIFSQHQTN
uniref:Uncharacterized protein n=1 Tax=Sinocyclocheilus grahami TaxID=75366 RepID=A0A672LNN1_SINGR